jgi:hypothetical protein
MHLRRTTISDPIFVVRSCKASDIYGRTAAQHGDNGMSQRKVHEWVERFKGGRTSVDNERSGWPSTVTCFEVKQQIDQRIRDN